jgi:hypothetical protein
MDHSRPLVNCRPDKQSSKIKKKLFENLLFLKKKKQKDFYFCACATIPAMASIVEAAERAKVFWFFFQKRTMLFSYRATR